MTDTNVYFGRPGSLDILRLPRGGLTATRIRQSNTYQLASGGARASRLLSGSRQYTLAYEALTYADFATLLAYDQGHNGTGPFVLLDPGQRNMLTVNQSGATSLTYDTANFSITGSGGTITSSTTAVHRGPRSLAWSWTVTAPSTAVLSLSPPVADWPGIPCYIRPHSFGAVMLGGGSDAVITGQAVMSYLDVNGSPLGGTSTGTAQVSNSSTWTALTVSGTPPAGAAYLNCSIVVSGASVSNGSILYLSDFILNEGSTVDSPWTPGTDLRPVTIMSLADVQPGFYTSYRAGPVFVLQETGRVP
jgi:hypothetical protein